MKDVEHEIKKLEKALHDLKISQQKHFLLLENKIFELRARQLKPNTVTRGETRQRHFTGHVDRQKRRIHLGDHVEFITSGRYDSTEGIVNGFTSTRVYSTDYKNREIPRAPNNLVIKNKNELKRQYE